MVNGFRKPGFIRPSPRTGPDSRLPERRQVCTPSCCGTLLTWLLTAPTADDFAYGNAAKVP
jgi:hypothetical protein